MAIQLTEGMRANLFSLQQTTNLMDLTQKRMSTGKKVNTALDDPVNFFKSKDHYDRATDLAAKKDGMSEAIKTIEAANTGIEGIYDLLAQMKSLAQAAKTSTNTTDLANQFDVIRSHETGSNTLSVGGFSAATAGSIAGVTVAVANFGNNTVIEANISDIDDAVSNLRTEAQKLASNLSTISIREDFTQNMINTLNVGADNLVLADMNEEGANMLMLQTRQALGTTSLSLSSQAAQAVLRLF
jgi:flagellin-like hook-associated protein FlgL